MRQEVQLAIVRGTWIEPNGTSLLFGIVARFALAATFAVLFFAKSGHRTPARDGLEICGPNMTENCDFDPGSNLGRCPESALSHRAPLRATTLFFCYSSVRSDSVPLASLTEALVPTLTRVLAVFHCSVMVTWGQGNSFDTVRDSGGSVDAERIRRNGTTI